MTAAEFKKQQIREHPNFDFKAAAKEFNRKWGRGAYWPQLRVFIERYGSDGRSGATGN
jgi:hypothetical protein